MPFIINTYSITRITWYFYKIRPRVLISHIKLVKGGCIQFQALYVRGYMNSSVKKVRINKQPGRFLKLIIIHINRRHLLSLFYFGWMSWLISFVWASPSCEVRKATKNHTIFVPDLKRVITLTEGRSTHNQNLCQGHISILRFGIWIMFYTVVVHSPRVCLDRPRIISPRSRSQCARSQLPCTGHDSMLVAKICVQFITFPW